MLAVRFLVPRGPSKGGQRGVAVCYCVLDRVADPWPSHVRRDATADTTTQAAELTAVKPYMVLFLLLLLLQLLSQHNVVSCAESVDGMSVCTIA